ADDTVQHGLRGRVTASHCTAMGSYEPYYSSKLHGFLARSGINIVVNPYANSLIQGRLDVYPKRRGFAQLKELLAAGVNVSLGNDVIMDPWYLMGRADLVDAAHLALHFTYMSGLEEIPEMLRCATERGARTAKPTLRSSVSTYARWSGGTARSAQSARAWIHAASRARQTSHIAIRSSSSAHTTSTTPTNPVANHCFTFRSVCSSSGLTAT